MTRFGKLKILYRLLNSRIAGMTHAARVENFYREQADDYDESRARMLRGREELLESIELLVDDLGTFTGQVGRHPELHQLVGKADLKRSVVKS